MWRAFLVLVSLFIVVSFPTNDVLAATIQGQVTDDGGNPVSAVTVTAYRMIDPWSWNYEAGSNQNIDGNYSLTGLPAGTYRIEFRPWSDAYVTVVYASYAGWYFNGGTDLILGEQDDLTGIDVQLASASRIEGRVTDSNGMPIVGVQASAYRWNGNYWDQVSSGNTDTEGYYSIRGLGAGTYRVDFRDWNSGDYVGEAYDDLPGTADDAGIEITVGYEAVVSNINAVLAAASRIEGRVTDDAGQPVMHIEASAYRKKGNYWEWISYGYTDAGGKYSIGGLNADAYRVDFRDWNGDYINEAYDDIPGTAYDNGTGIMVGSGRIASNINAQLSSASRIVGRVTNTDGQPIEGVQASAYRWTGYYWNQVSSDSTDATGYYSIGGLGADTYRVDFHDWNGDYVGEAYNDLTGDVYNGGAAIPVGPGVIVSNINAVLATASRIEGRVTNLAADPLENINVTASRWNGSWWQEEGWDYSDSDGYYSLGGLSAGTYLIQYNDWNTYQYAPLVYSNYHNSNYWNGGPYDLVSVGSGVTIPEINAVMLEYASLYGTVYRADGAIPLANCLVVLRDHNTGYYRDHTYSDAFGDYMFERVAPGSFAVHAGPSADQYYLGQWLGGIMLIPIGWWQEWFYNDSPVPEGADEVVVYGADVGGIDMVLPAAGIISGTVTGSGSLQLGDVLVTAFTGTNYVYFDSYTDADGTYEIRGLFPGDYQIKVEAAAFKDEWWNNFHHRDGASTINVNTGDHYELNFDLEPGQSPAYFKIESDPPGALIFLNFYPTTNRTPALLEMGEAGWWDDAGNLLAPHYVSVEGPDGILMHVYDDNPVEAETVTIAFDLTATNLSTGALSIQTDPNGFEVYVNRLDVPVGTSPVVVENLEAASSTHMIFVKADDHMAPRPVMAYNVYAGQTNEIVIPVSSRVDTNRMMASVRSTPPGAQVFVNYMETTNVTDVVVDWLDPATHGGMGWSSASHTIMVKRPGFKQTLPRYVPEESGAMHQLVINMRLDEVEEAKDEDGNGLPDQIEEIYGLTGLSPGLGGADGDADGDGVSNMDEIRAGTNPMDDSDIFESTTAPMPMGPGMSFTFKSIPGRSYVVMCSADLMNPVWTYASGVVTATADETTVNITMPEGVECRFFRVIVLAP